MQRIAGSCHCEGIASGFRLPQQGPTTGVRQCACSFCKKHGGLWTAHPNGELEAVLHESEKVDRYRFGHGTAEVFVYSQCGGVPLVISNVAGRNRAVVTANTFTNVSPDEMQWTHTDIQGESVSDRLGRRHRPRHRSQQG